MTKMDINHRKQEHTASDKSNYNDNILNHLPQSYQVFYKICQGTGLDILRREKTFKEHKEP